MTKAEFLQEVNDIVENYRPKNWRKGQTVFNYIDDKYGVARTIQFQYGVDCFYDDTKIPEFLNIAFKLIKDE